MIHDFPENDLRRTWQEQTVFEAPIDIDEITQQARRFQRRIRWRNRLEYAAAVIGVVVYFVYIWVFESPWIRAGSLLFVFGGLSIIYQLHKRGSSRTVPTGASCAEFHRSELQRQRDALLSIMRWYVGPLIPGAVVFNIGIAAVHPWGPWLVLSLATAGWVALGLMVYMLNQRGARKLQREIDELQELLQGR